MTGHCGAIIFEDNGQYEIDYYTYNATYTFTPAAPKPGNLTSPLAFANVPGAPYEGSFPLCFNYTFETKGLGFAANLPKPALILDDVILKAEYELNF